MQVYSVPVQCNERKMLGYVHVQITRVFRVPPTHEERNRENSEREKGKAQGRCYVKKILKTEEKNDPFVIHLFLTYRNCGGRPHFQPLPAIPATHSQTVNLFGSPTSCGQRWSSRTWKSRRPAARGTTAADKRSFEAYIENETKTFGRHVTDEAPQRRHSATFGVVRTKSHPGGFQQHM